MDLSDLAESPLVLKPVFTVDELKALFDDMTEELFEKHSDLLTTGALYVHLFPDLDTLDQKKITRKTYPITNTYELKTGTLSQHDLTFNNPAFKQTDTKVNWFQFIHHEAEKKSKFMLDRLLEHGYKPVHEWDISYLNPGCVVGRHRDGLAPYLRYCFAIHQPEIDCSVNYGFKEFFFPSGTSYVMDGEVPHEVVNSADTARIYIIGSFADFSGCVPA